LLSNSTDGFTVKGITRMVNEHLEEDGITKRNGKPKSVSERTIYDDLNGIQDIFSQKVEIVRERSEGVTLVKYAHPTMSIFNVNITQEEYTRLMFILKQSKSLVDEGLYNETEHLIKRLLNPSSFSLVKQKELPTQFIQTDSTALDARWLNDLLQCITNKICIKMDYNRNGLIAKRYHLAPLALKQHKGKWYLVGHDLDNFEKDQKVFRVSRIVQLIRSSEKFPSITSYFNINEYFYHSIGIHQEVNGKTIHVSLQILDKFWMQELALFPMNETQRLTQLPDETMQLDIETYDSKELIDQLLVFGRGVKLISPESVRKKLLAKLEEMAANYSNE
jgi:predicted DNA-binding transcriptional regulator YafY